MKTMPHWPITIFYDHACDICRGLMRDYKRQDTKNRLQLIDISAPDFKAEQYGLDPSLVSLYLYAKDSRGQIVRGTDSFIWTWQALGKNFSAAVLGWPIIRVFAQPLYRVFSRYRYLFNKQKRYQRAGCKGACRWQKLV